MSYARRDRRVTAIGREFGAGMVIDGTARKIGSTVRMDIQLVEVAGERVVWSGTYDARVEQLLDVQRRIADEVALHLKLTTRADSTDSQADLTANPEAYQEYLAGRAMLARDDWTSVMAARDRFRRAVEMDSTFASAWSGLAASTLELTQNGLLAGPAAWEEVRHAASQALGYDPQLPEAHAMLAAVHAYTDWDMRRAEHHYTRALELDPSDAAARSGYANLLRNLGRFDEALEQIRRVLDLDSRQPQPLLQHATLLYLSGRSDQAVAILEGMLSERVGERGSPGTDRFAVPPFWPNFTLALARTELGSFEQALASLDLADPTGGRADTRALLGYILVKMGREQEARAILEMSDSATLGPVSGFHRAIIHVALGEHDRALELLEAAARERTRLVQLLGVEPKFRPLHSNPRFQALLEELGLTNGPARESAPSITAADRL